MSARAAIEQQLKIVAAEQKRQLAPLHDGLLLLECGLDSLCFAILVARLEDELNVDPFIEDETGAFPLTLGELIEFYDRALA